MVGAQGWWFDILDNAPNIITPGLGFTPSGAKVDFALAENQRGSGTSFLFDFSF